MTTKTEIDTKDLLLSNVITFFVSKKYDEYSLYFDSILQMLEKRSFKYSLDKKSTKLMKGFGEVIKLLNQCFQNQKISAIFIIEDDYLIFKHHTVSIGLPLLVKDCEEKKISQICSLAMELQEIFWEPISDRIIDKISNNVCGEQSENNTLCQKVSDNGKNTTIDESSKYDIICSVRDILDDSLVHAFLSYLNNRFLRKGIPFHLVLLNKNINLLPGSPTIINKSYQEDLNLIEDLKRSIKSQLHQIESNFFMLLSDKMGVLIHGGKVTIDIKTYGGIQNAESLIAKANNVFTQDFNGRKFIISNNNGSSLQISIKEKSND